LPVLPAVAILTGCHFEILIRRHKRSLERYLSILGGIAVVATSVPLLVGLCHVLGLVVLTAFPLSMLAWNCGLLAMALVATIIVLCSTKDETRPYWLRFVVVICALRLAVSTVEPPIEAWCGNERRQLAAVLTGRLPAVDLHGGHGPVLATTTALDLPQPGIPGANGGTGESPTREVELPQVALLQGLPPEAKVVYIARANLGSESFYLGRLVLKVDKLEQDLPTDEPVVYVLAGAQAPILPSRIWTPASPLLDSRCRNALVWSWLPSTWCVVQVFVQPRVGDRPNEIRLYRGDLR